MTEATRLWFWIVIASVTVVLFVFFWFLWGWMDKNTEWDKRDRD